MGQNALHSKCSDASVREESDRSDGCAAVQRDFNRLERWADKNDNESKYLLWLKKL